MRFALTKQQDILEPCPFDTQNCNYMSKQWQSNFDPSWCLCYEISNCNFQSKSTLSAHTHHNNLGCHVGTWRPNTGSEAAFKKANISLISSCHTEISIASCLAMYQASSYQILDSNSS